MLLKKTALSREMCKQKEGNLVQCFSETVRRYSRRRADESSRLISYSKEEKCEDDKGH